MAERKRPFAILVLVLFAGVWFSGCIIADAPEELADNVCAGMSGLDRDHCYQYLARTSRDAKYCEKIVNPGPWSKCYIYLLQCGELSRQATGDGAYTYYDCIQWIGVQTHSILMCNEIGEGLRFGSNDLNPKGVSRQTCIDLATENCGHIGQDACEDPFSRNNLTKKYCVAGKLDMGKCVPDT